MILTKPTVCNLFDAIRKTLCLTAKLCADLGITEWRQYKLIKIYTPK